MAQQDEDSRIVCSAGCKRTGVIADDGTLPPGWEELGITGRYRCPQCWRDLQAARNIQGTESKFEPDPLPAESHGALKKLPEREPLREKVKP